MKKLFYISAFVTLFVMFSGNSFAQIRKIPAEVTSSLSEKYPHATNVEWRDRLTGFTATFTIDEETHIASFNNKGEWESTETAITMDDLPDSVKDGFQKSKYADWNIPQVSKVDLPGDKVQYKVEVAKGDLKKRVLYFNSKGRLIKDNITI